jgi:hypothetical protein
MVYMLLCAFSLCSLRMFGSAKTFLHMGHFNIVLFIESLAFVVTFYKEVVTGYRALLVANCDNMHFYCH